MDQTTTGLTRAGKVLDGALWSTYLVAAASAVVGLLGWVLLVASAPDAESTQGWTGTHVLLLAFAVIGTVLASSFGAAAVVLRTAQRTGVLDR